MKARFLIPLSAMLLTNVVLAHEFKHGGLDIDHPWARASVPGTQTGAIYLKITNPSKAADALLSASNPDLADKVEIHNHVNDNGVMRMRQVSQVDVPAGGQALLKPHSYHIMLMGLKKPLVQGEKLPLTLRFKQAGEVRVEVKVEPIDVDPDTLHKGH
ncbi:copper chaperone PCu(A)C [Chitinivorax sp. B]|uniref:copper chaperone PCu(A)C n=1 Tax=Chitinivorax sp. B TaxID=2502235 RepID=UPI0010F563B1|nr:copper chaperone PCu(A)C [Chitinivorax sp. B]